MRKPYMLRTVTCRTLCLVAAVAALLWAHNASALGDLTTPAASRDEARRLFEQAEVHFSKGNYRAALRDYDRAHKLSHLPGFLLNMADCETHLGNAREATRLLRAYLEHSGEDAPHRDAAMQALNELEAADAQDGEQDSAPPSREDSAPAVEPEGVASTWRGPLLPLRDPDVDTTPPAAPPAALAVASDASPDDDLSARDKASRHRKWFWGGAAAVAVVAATMALAFALPGGDAAVEKGSLGSLSR